MTFTEANKFLDLLEKDVLNSDCEKHTKIHLVGLIKTLRYYLPHLYRLLPARIDE